MNTKSSSEWMQWAWCGFLEWGARGWVYIMARADTLALEAVYREEGF